LLEEIDGELTPVKTIPRPFKLDSQTGVLSVQTGDNSKAGIYTFSLNYIMDSE